MIPGLCRAPRIVQGRCCHPERVLCPGTCLFRTGRSPALSSASLPLHAVVRLPRTAAVRRALMVLGFLGGLLALGLLLGGGTAHAAEAGDGWGRAPSASGTVGGDEDPASSAMRDAVAEDRDNASVPAPPEDGVPDGVPARDPVERALPQVAAGSEHETRPFRDLLENVAGRPPVEPPPPGDTADGQQPGDRPVDRAPSDRPAVEGADGQGDVNRDAGTDAIGGRDSVVDERSAERAPGGDRDRRTPPPGSPFPADAPVPSGYGYTSQCVGDGSGHNRGGGDVQATVWAGTTEFGLAACGVTAERRSPLSERPSEVLELPG